jgi:uncharacterized membrane-anchored protein YhcB (DUF1043 family)
VVKLGKMAMPLEIQFDLFHDPQTSEIKALHEEVDKLKTSLDKQRKKQFSLISEHTKIIADLKQRLEILEHYICKGNYVLPDSTNSTSSHNLHS